MSKAEYDLKVLSAWVKITRSDLLSADFESPDGHIKVRTERRGGGFGMGHNVHYMTTGTQETIHFSLREVYERMWIYYHEQKGAGV
jgi:hypothetical protein